MKLRLIVLASVLFFSMSASAQFFKPKPLPTVEAKLGASLSNPLVKNFVKPIIGVTALVSNGTQLAGGVGVAFQHDKFDAASNSWVISYSVSAVGFLGVGGGRITGTGGLIFGIPGTAGIVQIGPGYDFTYKQIVLLTGVGINF